MDHKFQAWRGHLRAVLASEQIDTDVIVIAEGGTVTHHTSATQVALTLAAAGADPPLTAALAEGYLEPKVAAAVLDALAPDAPASISAAEAAALAAEVADWSLSDAELAELLNRDVEVAGEATTKRAGIAMRDLMGALAPATRVGIMQHYCREDLITSVRRDDHESVELWLQLLMDDGTVGPAEGAALVGMLARTETTPGPTVRVESWSHRVLGRGVKAADVAAARP